MKYVVLMLACLVALNSCGPQSTTGNGLPGCGECQAQTEALEVVIAGMDGVREVISISYVTARNITRPAGVQVELGIAPGSHDAIAEAIAQAGWNSRIEPLEVIDLATVESEAPAQNTSIEYFESRTEEYEAKWGPRPVE